MLVDLVLKVCLRLTCKVSSPLWKWIKRIFFCFDLKLSLPSTSSPQLYSFFNNSFSLDQILFLIHKCNYIVTSSIDYLCYKLLVNVYLQKKTVWTKNFSLVHITVDVCEFQNKIQIYFVHRTTLFELTIIN